jgi:hypothetical protein
VISHVRRPRAMRTGRRGDTTEVVGFGAFATPSLASDIDVPDSAPVRPGNGTGVKTVLRNISGLVAYAIPATDGDLGRVEDYIIDDETSHVRRPVVDTGKWLPGRSVLISPHWIKRGAWHEAKVIGDLSRDELEGSLEFDPLQPVSGDPRRTVPQQSVGAVVPLHVGVVTLDGEGTDGTVCWRGPAPGCQPGWQAYCGYEPVADRHRAARNRLRRRRTRPGCLSPSATLRRRAVSLEISACPGCGTTPRRWPHPPPAR